MTRKSCAVGMHNAILRNYLNLEKRNYNRKTINEIKLENDDTTTDETQILSMIQTYYSNLYNSQATDAQDRFEIFTESMEIPKLDDAGRDILDGPLTYEECKKSLETFANGKSPGEDGFTVEFHKYFFDLVGADLLASLKIEHMSLEGSRSLSVGA